MTAEESRRRVLSCSVKVWITEFSQRSVGPKMGADSASEIWTDGSGYRDGIYYSKRAKVNIPDDPFLDFTTFALSSTKYSDRVVLVDALSGESITYKELRERAKSMAAGLTKIGVKQGGVIMILSLNSIHVPVLLYAVASLGAVLTTMNPLSTNAEIARQAKMTKSAFVAATPELVGKAATLGLPLVVIDGAHDAPSPSVSRKLRGVPAVFYFSELLEAEKSFVPRVRIRQTDTLLILFSSGTTGLSKGVMMSHGNVIAASCQSHDPSYRDDEQRTHMLAIPMFHIYGMMLLVCAQISMGSRLVVLARFEFQKFLAAIEKYKVTHCQVVPPIFIAMTKSPLVNKYDLRSLQMIGVGGAPIFKDTVVACSKKYTHAFLREGYALTETGGIATNTPNDSGPPRYGSVGVLAPNMEAKIVHLDSGKCLPPSQNGEIYLRGPAVMQGYLQNANATAETKDKDGWLHSGDIGHFGEDGYLYIVDRLKELIKYNGYQVAPAELEAVLTSHPQIADAGVTGAPNELTGQIPVAFVVRQRKSTLSEDDVKRFVAEQVSPQKKVRKVVFVESIPRSPSGKILRRQLKIPSAPAAKL